MSVLIIVEHDNQQLNPVTLNIMTAAKAINDDIVALVAGFNCQSVAEEVSHLAHVNKVLLADSSEYEYHLAENVASLIHQCGTSYTHIMAPATTFGKNIMPRVAALFDVGQISDVIQIISEDTFQRPIYAGNAIATIQSKDPIKILTIRTTAFDAVSSSEDSKPIETLTINADLGLSQFVKQEKSQSERPDLLSARVVIAGGRGLQSAEKFKLLETLADKLNAAIGASRAAVDAGFVSNDYQVGQTGKVVAPELYIAVGISGAIQHVSGMKDSKIIVAINKDEDAPIFKIANYGLVGDLFEIIPELILELGNNNN